MPYFIYLMDSRSFVEDSETSLQGSWTCVCESVCTTNGSCLLLPLGQVVMKSVGSEFGYCWMGLLDF